MPEEEVQKPRRPIQIAVYAKPWLYEHVRHEAQRRRRKLGPTVVDILTDYFIQLEGHYKYNFDLSNVKLERAKKTAKTAQ